MPNRIAAITISMGEFARMETSQQSCLLCNTRTTTPVLDLGAIPPVNAFRSASETGEEERFPLQLVFCCTCCLLQVANPVSPDRLYRNYHHLSSASVDNAAHLRAVASLIFEKLAVLPKKLQRVLEVGCNDGTLMDELRHRNIDVVGVDPAENLQAVTRRKGHTVLCEFFDESNASRLREKYGPFGVIVGINVFAHSSDFPSMFRGLRLLLEDGGMATLEVAYAGDTVLSGAFDTVYHEHVCNYTLTSLVSIAKSFDFCILEVERLGTQGASLRITIGKKPRSAPPSRLDELLALERRQGIGDAKSYADVEPRARHFRRRFGEALRPLREEGGPLVGLGAPARGVVLMNYCGIDASLISEIWDDSPTKHAKYVPGTRIPVRSWPESAPTARTNFVLFSWNYCQGISARLRSKALVGRMLVPFPTLEVVDVLPTAP